MKSAEVREIPFNSVWLSGKENEYISRALALGRLSGDNHFSRRCEEFFRTNYGFTNTMLVPSCTAALEMAAMLLDIKPGDEVIVPSFTFVSTANAFASRGARIVFADCLSEYPNIDPEDVKQKITSATKAVVVVHYGGIAFGLEELVNICREKNIPLIEDAAHAIDAYCDGKPLGSFGAMSAFSFHDTKNITCGEGGLLVINDDSFLARAQVIREKGTNRKAWLDKKVREYVWTDHGSSFLLSEVCAAMLLSQLENIGHVQEKRKSLLGTYVRELIGKFPDVAKLSADGGNANMMFVTCSAKTERDNLIGFLKKSGITSQFHYLPLSESPFARTNFGIQKCPNAQRFADTVLRLPLFPDLSDDDVNYISSRILEYYK